MKMLSKIKLIKEYSKQYKKLFGYSLKSDYPGFDWSTISKEEILNMIESDKNLYSKKL